MPKTEKCKITDDMQKIYPKLIEADALVIGSPNYFKNVSGLMKDFIDRTNCLLYPKTKRKLERKKVIGISVGGEELEDIAYCEIALGRFFKSHRMNVLALVKGQADLKNEIRKKIGILVELEMVVNKLF